MEGSLRTIPSPRTNTRVFAVPRSIARSSENCSAQRLKNITLPDSFQIYHVPRGGSSPAETSALVSGRDVELELERVTVRRQFRELLSILHIQPAQRSGRSVAFRGGSGLGTPAIRSIGGCLFAAFSSIGRPRILNASRTHGAVATADLLV